MRRQKARNADGGRWQCSACKSSASLRSGSFWAHSHIEMRRLLTLVFFWSCQLEGETIAAHSGLSERTVSKWSQRLQILCSHAVEKARRPIGGFGKTVSLDETHLARRKWTGNGQARSVSALWLYGAVEHESREVVARIVPVETGRTRPTMEKLIRETVRAGSTIMSDSFRSYDHISEMQMQYRHEQINHRVCYSERRDGLLITTNPIESCWSSLKRYLRRRQSVPRRTLQQHVNVWLWLRRRPKERVLHDLLQLIAEYLNNHARRQPQSQARN